MRRSREQLQRDRAETARLYLQGWLQIDIAKKQGVEQSTISDDLAAIRKQWLASAIRDFDEARAQELAKIDILEIEYWQAWQRSLKSKKTETAKTSSGKIRQDEASVKEEFRDGDPRFLAGVERCIERRCKLLGLDAVTSGSEDKPFIVKVLQGVSMDDL